MQSYKKKQYLAFTVPGSIMTLCWSGSVRANCISLLFSGPSAATALAAVAAYLLQEWKCGDFKQTYVIF